MRKYFVSALLLTLGLSCAREPNRITLTISGSAVGAEAQALRHQLARFMAQNPSIDVVLLPTPDAADQRHQLYVQWLNANSPTPDVLQLDVIWTPELAAAGWLYPLDDFAPEEAAFFPSTIQANRWNGSLYALPWFVDVGVLYWRKDLLDKAPSSLEELWQAAKQARSKYKLDYGFVWQGARYEGLITVFVEHLGAFGGEILSEDGEVQLTQPPAKAALSFMKDAIDARVTPKEVLTWQEEQTRFAFQSGRALFMRNWPYAYPLLQDPKSSNVSGRVGVAPMPAAKGGQPTATVGGAQLAINAKSAHPKEAYALIKFLTDEAQLIERAQLVGQYPPRPALYQGEILAGALPIPPGDIVQIIERSVPRPVTPLYTQLSGRLQGELHRALSAQTSPEEALVTASEELHQILTKPSAPPAPVLPYLVGAALSLGLLCFLVYRSLRRSEKGLRGESRFAWLLAAPALVVLLVVVLAPLFWVVWGSMQSDAPSQGREFIGLANYQEALSSERFWGALGRTAFFTALSVSLELFLGLCLALLLNQAFSGQRFARALVILPWALPAVVAALLWRFLFEGRAGVAGSVMVGLGLSEAPPLWLADATLAWVPLILADVWKTTPFVGLLLLAGLQNIEGSLSEAARMDGASWWQELYYVTLPLLKPTFLVVLLFRTLDALRIFDLVYVLTQGGPGVSTEPIALYTFTSLLQELRFGYGAALSLLIFLFSFLVALFFIRVLGVRMGGAHEE